MPNVTLHEYEYDKPENLPGACVVCGQNAEQFVERTFTWRPPWLALLIFLGWIGIIIWVLILNILKRSCTLLLPVCNEHLTYFRYRNFIYTLLITIAFGCLFAGVTSLFFVNRDYTGLTMLPSLFGFLFFLIFANVYNSFGITARHINYCTITFRNIHESFIREIRAEREALIQSETHDGEADAEHHN
jgi:hypothetical protein